MPVRRHEPRTEPTLEQMPVERVASIEGLRVTAEQPLHPFGQVLLRRDDQQVEVVAHQAIRMAVPPVAIDGRRDSSEKPLAIDVVEEDRLASVAACRDVKDAVRRPETERSRHELESTRPGRALRRLRRSWRTNRRTFVTCPGVRPQDEAGSGHAGARPGVRRWRPARCLRRPARPLRFDAGRRARSASAPPARPR